MALDKKVFPYEILWRGDHKKVALKGYHVKMMTVITEDGVEISRAEGDAITAKSAAALGYDLTALMDIVQTTALAAMDEAKAQAESDVAAANKAKDEAVAATKTELQTATGRIAQLEKQNAEITAAVPVV